MFGIGGALDLSAILRSVDGVSHAGDGDRARGADGTPGKFVGSA